MNGIIQQPEPVIAHDDKGARSGVNRGAIFDYFPFIAAVAVLCLAFALPLFRLIKFALAETFYSHILLIPAICAYLIWIDRSALPKPSRGSGLLALPIAVVALGILGSYFFQPDPVPAADGLFFTILPFCLLLASVAVFFLGASFSWAIAFPLGFLFFIVPFPEVVTNALEIGSQRASAEVFDWMIWLSGTPYFRQDQTFSLPGLSLVIAQECSGIRSSFVLFITSLLAGKMFLRSPWRRGFLAFFVIPLGIVRNGFRVLTLAILTIHWHPDVIHSPLHHRGGPIFFALSLIPFFLVLYWLRRSERVQSTAAAPNNSRT